MLEVTEHSSIEDYAPLIEARMRLREHGIRLAVDDAGAGYASFRHIVALAPDIIKIDRTIVSGVDKDTARSALVGAVVMFAHGSRRHHRRRGSRDHQRAGLPDQPRGGHPAGPPHRHADQHAG